MVMDKNWQGAVAALSIVGGLWFGSHVLDKVIDKVADTNYNRGRAETHGVQTPGTNKNCDHKYHKNVSPQKTSPQSIDPLSFAVGEKVGRLEGTIEELKNHQNTNNCNGIYNASSTSLIVSSNGFAYQNINGMPMLGGYGYGPGWMPLPVPLAVYARRGSRRNY